MGVASAAVPVAAPASRGLTWGLWAFIWLLPFHIVAIAALFGIVGLPLLVVRGIAAWKEATVVLLVALTLLGALRGRTARSPVQGTDLAVTALCALACVYLLGATVWFSSVLPAITLWLFSGARRRPTLGWVGYALLWTGLLLTVTRTTIITCAIQVLALAGARRRWGTAVSAGLAGLVGFSLALVAVPGLATFLWDTLTWQTGSSVGHLADWSMGAQSLVEYPLGLGLGAGGLTSARFGLTSAAADSQYFKYSAELGLAALALYLAILVGIAAAGLKAFRTAPGAPAGTGRALVPGAPARRAPTG